VINNTDSPGNLIDTVEDLLRACGSQHDAIAQVSRRRTGPDLYIVGRNADWLSTDVGRATVDAISSHSDVACAECDKDNIRVVLTRGCVERLGVDLEQGLGRTLAVKHLATNRKFIVDYCDPNATKALHVGHLRNIALGHTLASVASRCGGKVVRQSQVGDMGRSMGEALAGYQRFADGATPELNKSKSDHFVGDCYARYVHDFDATPSDEDVISDPVLSRESASLDDLATRLLARWREGDEEVVSLWHRLRDWAVAGQAATLARLGAPIDCTLFESDYADRAVDLAEIAVRCGIARRLSTGAVAYATGHEEYPYLLLRRADGLPTQHLRYIALRCSVDPLRRDATSVEVMGDEWFRLVPYCEQILRLLFPARRSPTTFYIGHGMVTMGDGLVKSSHGEALLIDDLLDALRADRRLTSLSARCERIGIDDLVAIVVLGLFLGYPVRRETTFTYQSLFDIGKNPGWAIACAVASSCEPKYDGDPEPLTSDPDYRYLIRHSQLHTRFVRDMLERFDPFPCARYYGHLSRWYLARVPTASLARAMRTVLGEGLSTLGLSGAGLSLSTDFDGRSVRPVA
jgi:tRNA synthetases class I (R)